MKAVIFAGGKGSRMRSPSSLPKHLLPIGGIPIIERAVLSLTEAGVTEIFIIIKNNLKIKEYFEKARMKSSLHFITSNTKNLADAFFILEDLLGQDRDKFVLLFGDIVFNSGVLHKFINDTYDSEYDIVLAVTEADGCDYEVTLNEKNEIVRIGEKDRHNYSGAGIFILSPKLFSAFSSEEKEKISTISEMLDLYLKKGFRGLAYKVSGVYDIDTKEDLKKARRLLK